MSVLIKDMDMPKYCGVNECPLCTLGWRDKNRYTEWCHRPNGGGFVMVGYHGEENKIPDDCPLGKIPTPHGRLIDADALKEMICSHVYPVVDYFNNKDYGMFWTGGIEKAIDEQPTIDAEPVRHAKNIGTDYDEIDQFVCSECGIELQGWYRVERDEDDGEETYHEYRIRRCPNCGARIDEKDAERKEE